MIKRTYTVIFVPHTGERHKKWRLTAGALKTLAVLAGAALIQRDAPTLRATSEQVGQDHGADPDQIRMTLFRK